MSSALTWMRRAGSVPISTTAGERSSDSHMSVTEEALVFCRYGPLRNRVPASGLASAIRAAAARARTTTTPPRVTDTVS